MNFISRASIVAAFYLLPSISLADEDTFIFEGSPSNDLIIVEGWQIKLASSSHPLNPTTPIHRFTVTKNFPRSVQKIVINGQAGDDHIINLSDHPCEINGGPGDDFLCGGPSDGELLNGGPGDDGLFGGAWEFDDKGVIEKRSDRLVGGPGSDRFFVGIGGKPSELTRVHFDRLKNMPSRLSARSQDYLREKDVRLLLGNSKRAITRGPELRLTPASWAPNDVRRLDRAIDQMIFGTSQATVMRRTRNSNYDELLITRYGRPINSSDPSKETQNVSFAGANHSWNVILTENAFTYYPKIKDPSQHQIPIDTAAAANQGYDPVNRPNNLRWTLWHELAHGWDTPDSFGEHFPGLVDQRGDLVTEFRTFAGWSEKDDKNWAFDTARTMSPGNAFPAEYAKENAKEDWALSFSMYLHCLFKLDYNVGGGRSESPARIAERCKTRYQFFLRHGSAMTR